MSIHYQIFSFTIGKDKFAYLFEIYYLEPISKTLLFIGAKRNETFINCIFFIKSIYK